MDSWTKSSNFHQFQQEVSNNNHYKVNTCRLYKAMPNIHMYYSGKNIDLYFRASSNSEHHNGDIGISYM